MCLRHFYLFRTGRVEGANAYCRVMMVDDIQNPFLFPSLRVGSAWSVIRVIVVAYCKYMHFCSHAAREL